jgi:hypothetical protein
MPSGCRLSAQPQQATLTRLAVLVASAALGAEDAGQGVGGGAWIGMRIEAAMAFGADAAPLPHEQSAAEEVGPDLHAVIAPLVQRWPDTN